MRPRDAWMLWAVGGVASFVVLEAWSYERGETLTSQVARFRDSHPLARMALAASLGAVAAGVADHMLHHPAPADLDRLREAGW